MTHEQSLVALFIPNFEAGGAERVMIRLAQGLVEQGHSVDLVVLAEHGPYRKEVDPRINVINLGASRALRGLLPLIAYLRSRQPKTLLSAIFHANFIAVLAGRLAGTKTRIVISEHNTLGLIKSAVRPLSWFVFQAALRLTYPRADAVVCVSVGIANGLTKTMPQLASKITVINNPVVTDDVLRCSTEAVQHPWLAPNHPPLVLAAGRLITAKGFDILIEAFAQVVASRPAKLLILGEGPERTSLQALIDKYDLSEHVSLYGFTPNPYAWMSKADLFVLSSRHEGLPGVLIEAMACGCKVVATDCPYGPDEILEDGKWGRLVPVENPSALAHAIVEELNSTRDIDTAMRAHVYHLTNVMPQYEKVLRL